MNDARRILYAMAPDETPAVAPLIAVKPSMPVKNLEANHRYYPLACSPFPKKA
jgi:hypothetical protein